MYILVTNDDGIHAPGLMALYQALAAAHEVAVVAPESEQSAVGHAISLLNPLRVKKVNKNGSFFGWAVSGTPADCVKIAVAEILPQRPDLVVSGINHGANVGINVLYSGTVSAATEATIMGIRAMAVSLSTFREADFQVAAHCAARLVQELPHLPLPPRVCLNVNVPSLPANQIKGVMLTRQENGLLVERYERRVDPRENIYYWLAGINSKRHLEPGTDYWAVENGYISITPIHHDLTHYDCLQTLARMEWPEE
ncbi:MAG: 5'/3'-nucleotidase SurE [Desulfobacca sp.]|uniref:5'/3'-nucleotidase SurE n=1 Tax=Desulfobacca sp. TaxID=2067990 RepID=UPI004049D700